MLVTELVAELVAGSGMAETIALEDRRSLRSKRMLREAFAELTQERGLDGFSVGELAERADLNRSTFYAHFRDIPDLLACLEEEIIASLASLRPQLAHVSLAEYIGFASQGKPPRVAIELFAKLREQGPLLRVLLSPQGDAAFAGRLRDRLCTDLIRSVLHEKYTNDPTPFVEYYIAYYASAVLGLIHHWLKTGMREGDEEMARTMLSIMFLRPGDPIALQEQTQ
jgi:AcrR family transcriptional regulator